MNLLWLAKSLSVPAHIVFLITVALAGTTPAQKNDVRPGMLMSDAMTIARRCVLAASNHGEYKPEEGDKIPAEDPKPLDKLQPQDTLERAGITDNLRLDALRRYIVRNTDLGVQSIWGKANELDVRPYIIANQSMAKVDKSWTIEKLAQEISKHAGLPKLTLDKAGAIVRGCRDKIKPGSNEKLATEKKINEDINPAKSQELIDCLVNKCTNGKSDWEKGVGSAWLRNPRGKAYFYELDDARGQMKKIIEDGGSYKNLIEFIADHAEVPETPYQTATQLVVNAIFFAPVGKTTEARTTKCSPSSFNPHECRINGNPLNDEATLADLNIKVSDFYQALYGPPCRIGEPNKDHCKVPEPSGKYLPATTVPRPSGRCGTLRRIERLGTIHSDGTKIMFADKAEITTATKVSKMILIISKEIRTMNIEQEAQKK